MRRTGRRTKVPGIQYLGNGRYRIRARVVDIRTGRVIERDRVIAAKTDAEAVLQKLKLVEELKGSGETIRSPVGRPTPIEGTTLGDFATRWLRGQWATLCPTTRSRYLQSLDAHVLPELGNVALDELRQEDIEAWRDKMSAKGYRATTINGHLRLLKTVMARAVRAERLAFDPALDVKPLPEDDTRITDDEPNALEPDELRRFMVAARRLYPQHLPMLAVLFTTAMRMSACRALQWTDIDFERGLITVRRRVSGLEVVSGVKRSRKGKDVVPLLAELAALLEEHRASLNEAQRASGLVFPSAEGKLRSRSVLMTPMKRIAREAGIEKRFTPHGCRRTANDAYRRAASEVVAMSITGHLSREMHAHYSTVGEEEKKTAARRAFPPELFQIGGPDGGPEPPKLRVVR